jgi:hypothetical protein
MSQTIKLDKKEIEDNINRHKFNEFNPLLNISWPEMIISETAAHNIRKEIKFALSELNHSWEGTYVFLCQDNSVYLYGLYKGEDSKIYLVKSFMDSIILVVKFERKLLHRN